MTRIGTNSGHGHVWARPDGQRERCAGPGVCPECTADLNEVKNDNRFYVRVIEYSQDTGKVRSVRYFDSMSEANAYYDEHPVPSDSGRMFITDAKRHLKEPESIRLENL